MIDLASLRMGSLFSGVGGLELGLEWAGVGRTAWQVEIDPWCRGVLAMHWPHARRYENVERVGTKGEPLERVAIICGGFPCQDISTAGKRVGLDGSRSGLWREFARIVGEVAPLVVVVENVARLASSGLDRVVGDLEGLGYDVEARLVSASDVGAPHRRERIFIVGYADMRGQPEPKGVLGEVGRRTADADTPMAHAVGNGLRNLEQWEPGRQSDGLRNGGEAVAVDDGSSGWRRAQSGLGRSAHGPADRVDRWPARPGDGTAFWEPARAMKGYSPTRTARLHALGNAVVPQCLAPVAQRIRERLALRFGA